MPAPQLKVEDGPQVTENRHDVFTLSNILSVSRLALLPFILLCVQEEQPWYRYITLLLIALAMLSDCLDGYLARRRGETTNLGKILDPLVDKITLGFLAFMLVYYRSFPMWMAFVIVGKDILIAIAGLSVIGKRKIIMTANKWGRATVNILWILLLCYVLEIDFMKLPLLLLAMIFVTMSLASYGLRALTLMKSRI